MIYKYEMACKEAGMSEEEIRRNRQVFDTDYKQLKRMNERKYSSGFEFVSADFAVNGDGDAASFDIPDEFDLEESFIHKCDLERLSEVLDLLSDEDRCFILDAFNTEFKTITTLAEKYGITWYVAKTRKEKLLALLRENFLG